MIEFACKHCQQSIRLSSNRAGISGKCPHCTEPVTVPSTSDLPQHDDVFVEFEPTQPIVSAPSEGSEGADFGGTIRYVCQKRYSVIFWTAFSGAVPNERLAASISVAAATGRCGIAHPTFI
jgi:hypothetical protein